MLRLPIIISLNWLELSMKEDIHLIRFATLMRRHCIGKRYHLGPSFGKIKGVLRGLKFQKNVSPIMCAAIYQGAS
jgi:hypothetical protein